MQIQNIDFTADIQKSLLWQYENAPNLKELVQRQQVWFDNNQTEFWNDWYNNVFNLATADDFGLVVWSIILGLPLFVEITPDDINKKIFGFEEFWENYDNGSYSSESQSGIVLTLLERRLVLQLRYFQLITRCAVTEINLNLNRIFAPLGSLYVLDNLVMTCEYVFDFTPSQNLLDALIQFDLLPRPQAVDITIVTPP